MQATLWVLADDRAGNVNQALGVAEATGLPFVVKVLRYTALARLPNALLGVGLAGLDTASRAALAPPWPDAVIAAGRRTAPSARWIGRQSGGRTLLCQIMQPGGVGLGDFDLIAIPGHDRLARGGTTRPNVLRITGAPHRVTPARLAAEAERWRETFAALPRPRVALIVGGATRNRAFTPAMAAELGTRTAALARTASLPPGSILVTTSRRTGREAEAALLATVPEPRFVFRWGDVGDNPYFGFLALADAVVVTGDSVSMCSEACGGTAPVFIHAPPGSVTDKHARLHDELYRLGYARPLDQGADSLASLSSAVPPSPLSGEPRLLRAHPPLNAADEIARALRQRLAERLA